MDTRRADLEASISRVVAHWAALLGLGDWDIRVVHTDRIDGGETNASIDISSEYREAVLTVSDPLQIEHDLYDLARTLELIVVHELLHLYFYQANEDADEERALNRLARAIVGLTWAPRVE